MYHQQPKMIKKNCSFVCKTCVFYSAALVEKAHRVSLQEAVKLRTGVLVVSWISVFCLFSLGISSFSMLNFNVDILKNNLTDSLIHC